jgi:hypothetical protein
VYILTIIFIIIMKKVSWYSYELENFHCCVCCYILMGQDAGGTVRLYTNNYTFLIIMILLL